MERRVAQGQGEALLRPQDAAKDLLGVVLMAARYLAAQAIARRQQGRRLDRHGVDIRSHEAPAILTGPQQGIDAVCPDTYVQHPHPLAPWHLPRTLGQQIRHPMQVIDPARNGRTEVARRQIPVLDAVVQRQQGPVERLDGGRIGEIQGPGAMLVDEHEGQQLGGTLAEGVKIVRGLMAIARVQSGFVLGLHAGPAEDRRGPHYRESATESLNEGHKKPGFEEPGSSEVGKTVRTASRLSSLTQISIRRACQNLLRQ
ncbi:hypothetical protein D3C72_645490 [compost metagenome]